MNRFNKVALAVALCALSIGLIAAQQRGGGDGKHGCHGPNKEMVAALKTWAQANVLPQLRTWKAKLDGSMSAEDLQKLNALRARATQLRKDAMAAGEAMHNGPKDGSGDQFEQNRDKMKEFGDQRKALLDELRPIAEKYKPALQAIGAEALPKIQSWKEEGKAVAEKWMQDHKDQAAADSTGGHQCHGGKCGMGGMRGMMGGHDDMNPRAMAARFMLWDGNDPMDQVGQFDGGASAPGLK